MGRQDAAGPDLLGVFGRDLHRGDRRLAGVAQRADRGRRRRPVAARRGASSTPSTRRISSRPQLIALGELDAGMDSGRYNFTLVIPPDFQHDVQAGRKPDIQLNIDATIMTQAFIGATYIKTIALGEVNEFLTGTRDGSATPIKLTHARALQSQSRRLLVRRRHGGDQQRHPADHHPGRRRLHPRTRARHPRAPAGDAVETVRDHAGEDLGERAGGAARRKLRADGDGAAGAGGADRRLAAAVSRRDGVLPVCRRVDRHLPRHAGALDAAARSADHPQHPAAADALGRHLAAREHAGIRPEHHARGADDLFCPPRARHSLPRWRTGGRLAGPAGDDGGGGNILQRRAVPLPQVGDRDVG